MTRINGPIKPARICDQHLLAEYRELPRVSALAWAHHEKHGATVAGRPQGFVLGTGHVKFFYPLGAWLELRFDSICAELLARGYSLNFTTYRPHPAPLHNPLERAWTASERSLLVKRMVDRHPKKATIYGQPIGRDEYAALLRCRL